MTAVSPLSSWSSHVSALERVFVLPRKDASLDPAPNDRLLPTYGKGPPSRPALSPGLRRSGPGILFDADERKQV